VTILGEFSPFGRLLLWANFLKITEVAQILQLLFPTYTFYNLDKKRVGLHLDNIFKNSSGHPEQGGPDDFVKK
jgi:hypothetical protein